MMVRGNASVGEVGRGLHPPEYGRSLLACFGPDLIHLLRPARPAVH